MRCVWSVVLFLSVLPAALAQFLFNHITTADGLPSDRTFALHEDAQGFIWVGTETGLARLEGTRIRVFHHTPDDDRSLAHDQVNSIAEDTKGQLWFATMGGLSAYNARNGTFRSFRIRAVGNAAHQANRMLQVLCTGDSLVWVVSEQGLYRFRPRTGGFEAVDGRVAGEGPAGRVTARCWLFADTARNGLWAASSTGLAFWNGKSDRWTDHRNAPATAQWATECKAQTPVLHGRDSLWYFDAGTHSLVFHDLRSGASTPFDSIAGERNHFSVQWQEIDPDGGHWLSTWTHRLFHRPARGSWQEVTPSAATPAALRSAHVTASIRTRKGERWFGTRAGVAILRPSSMAMRVLSINGNSSHINRLLPFGRDSLLVGSYGSGVYVLDLRSLGQRNYRVGNPQDPSEAANWPDQVNHLQAIGPSAIHVLSTRGIATFDRRNATYGLDDRLIALIPGGSKMRFTFIAPGDSEEVWIGSWRQGLFIVDRSRGTCVQVDTTEGIHGRLPNRMTLSWLQDREGRRWLGMNDGGGLVRYENGRFSAVLDDHGGNLGGVIRCIAQAPDGRLWLGTHEEGIVVYDPNTGRSERVDRREGLPGTRVHNIVFDHAGTVWVTTSQGIARRAKGANAFRPVTLPDGLDPTNMGEALVELPDGRIMFGVGEHLVLWDPERERYTDRAPDVAFTSFRINDSLYYEEPTAELDALLADRKALTLELGAVYLTNASAPLFQYRLDGSETWNELGAAKRIDLFDLPAGAHVIEVRASTNGVDWSASPKRVKVRVLPPFWATWWFRGALLLGISAALYFFVRGYVNERLREQRERLEREQAVLAERMRIASDMHDDLGAGLSALKLRSEMALRVEKDPQKREQLGSLANTAGDLIGSMRQIIWTMNVDQSSIGDLVAYTTHYARTYCEQNGLAIAVEAAGPWPEARLSSEQRRNMFLVVKEALHNIVKHAHATSVDLHIRWDDGVRIELTDNGVGLPKGTEDAVGNGLRNMRKRIHSLNGTISMSGEKGTSLRFHVPIVPEN